MCHNGQIMNVGGLAEEKTNKTKKLKKTRKQKKVHSISLFHMMKLLFSTQDCRLFY